MMSFPRKYQTSQELHQRAQKLLVGGVNSPVRSFKRMGGQPILARNASGAKLWDVDGNEYIDFVMSYGPHLFGHTHPKIVESIKKAADSSTCLGMTSEGELEWAELFLKRVPGAEKVRAVSTGTEACSAAIRLARGVTQRDIIVKFSGHYHGHVDSLMVAAGSGIATLSESTVADSAGIPQALIQQARVLRFNDLEALRTLFENEGAAIAGVILEPIMGNMGVVPPTVEFLSELRRLCTEHKSILIFDEVMTGLRVHKNSAQGLYGVEPDLSTFGKICGGGLPLAALAGKAKFMDQLAPLGPVYQAGTLSGNPLCVSAGIAMMNLIDSEDPYAQLDVFAGRLQTLFEELGHQYKIPLRVERVSSMMSVYFREGAVKNDEDCRDIDEKRFAQFFWKMLDEGFMLPPSPFEAWFLGVPHTNLNWEIYESKLLRVFKDLSK